MSVRTALREPTDSHSLIHLPQQPAPPAGSGPDPAGPGEMPAMVARARAGDPAAFGLIYEQYFDTIYRFVHFRVGNRQTAEDITADTFVRALRRIDTFTWQGRDIGAWLVTIARNLVTDHFKSRRLRYEVASVDVLDPDGAHGEERADDNPEQNVIDYLTHRDVLRAVGQLSPDQRECIVLRFLHGLSVAETARIMGRNEGAVKALQFRARNVLARMLTEPAPTELPPDLPLKADGLRADGLRADGRGVDAPRAAIPPHRNERTDLGPARPTNRRA